MPKRYAITKDILEQLYIKEGLSMYDIARILSVSPTTIYLKLKNYSLLRPRRKKIDAETLYKLYVLQGLSTREIAEKTSVSQWTVLKQLKLHGIQPRNRTEGMRLSKSRNIRPFDGDTLIKSTMLAMKWTDYTAFRKRRRIMFETATTHGGQIMMTYAICSKYSPVRCRATFKPKSIPPHWEWDVTSALDESFDFLVINNDVQDLRWVLTSERAMLHHFAKAVECDGCIYIGPARSKNKVLMRICITSSNADYISLLKEILEKCGINSFTAKNRSPLSKKTLHIIGFNVSDKNAGFVERLPLDHPEKLWKRDIGMELYGCRLTVETQKKVEKVRQKILRLRNNTVNLSKEFYNNPKVSKTIDA